MTSSSQHSPSPIKSGGRLKDKLKTLLHLHKESDTECADWLIPNTQGTGYFIKPSILRSLSVESPLVDRLNALRDLKTAVQSKRLERGAVETLWLHVQDLATSATPDAADWSKDDQSEQATRKEVVEFLTVLCRNQFDKLGICRLTFFNFLLKHFAPKDDLTANLMFLRALTNDGEIVDDFDLELADLLQIYMNRLLTLTISSSPPSSPTKKSHQREINMDFLDLLKTFVKLHSSTCFDEHHVTRVLDFVCKFSCNSALENEEIFYCLAIINAVFCYSCWSKDSLPLLVTCLAKLVNNTVLCQEVWRTARILLGTYYGHTALKVMCGFLERAESSSATDHSVIRGFIFFIGMSLWGSQRVESLRNTPSSILPYFLQALINCQSSIVTFEILLTCQRLVQKYGRDLQLITWDWLMQILERIYQSEIDKKDSTVVLSRDQKILTLFHDILTNIETYCEDNVFSGSAEQFYTIVEKCMKERSENSAYRVMNFHLQSISPSKYGWTEKLRRMADVFYKQERRTNVRIRLVQNFREFYDDFSYIYAEELVENVYLHAFCGFYNEIDAQVQSAVIGFLLNICKSSRKDTFYQLITLIEKFVVCRIESCDFIGDGDNDGDVIAKNFDQSDQHHNQHISPDNVHRCVSGLIEIVKRKWSKHPGDECLRVLNILYMHLRVQYGKKMISAAGFESRLAIIKFFGSLKADLQTNRLIYVEQEDNVVAAAIQKSTISYVVESYYIYCSDYTDDPTLSYFTSNEILSVFQQCLTCEPHYKVFYEFSKILPNFLLNRTLVLTDCDQLCRLCQAMLNFCQQQQNLADRAACMFHAPDKLSWVELYELIFPSLCSLVSYSLYFDEQMEKRLASVIIGGAISQNSVHVIVAAIICVFEMPDVMTPMMSDFIAKIHRLPHTPTLAIPIFEFLSTLMRMPDLYSAFGYEQYEQVYAIMLPYTNPFRFTEVIVAVAYHVIFKFFLRIPLKFRPRVAKHALRLASRVDMEMKHEESVIDKTSQKKLVTNLASLNESARKIFVLFLSHYSFNNEQSHQKRSHFAEILFKKCQTQYFFIGDNIFSVTMSRSNYADSTWLNTNAGNQVDNGQEWTMNRYCPKCRKAFTQYRRQQQDDGSSLAFSANEVVPKSMEISKNDKTTAIGKEKSIADDIQSIRRRYKSAVQKRVTEPELKRNVSSLDDSFLLDRTRNRSEPLESMDSKDPFRRSVKQTLSHLRPCVCWCRGFVEICIRHAFGQSYWIVRSQEAANQKTTTGNNNNNNFWVDEKHAELFFSFLDAKLRAEEMTHAANDFAANQFAIAAGTCDEQQQQPTEISCDQNLSVASQISPYHNALGYVMNFDSELRPPDDNNIEFELADANKFAHTEVADNANANGSFTSANDSAAGANANDPATGVDATCDRLLTRSTDIVADLKTDVANNVSHNDSPNSKAAGLISSPDEQQQSPPKSDSSNTPSNNNNNNNDPPEQMDESEIKYFLLQLFNFCLPPGTNFPFSSIDQSKVSNDIPPSSSVYYLSCNEASQRSLKLLDRIRPQEAQKVGVLYVKAGQTKEREILANRCGSDRYAKFLSGLGKLICLKDVDQFETYLGGLAQDGSDGEFAYYWSDQVTQLIFHVGTLMPNKTSDPNCHNKKRHIGNNHVTIVFNESGCDYKLNTISGQFTYVAIVVEPLDLTTLRVTLKAKDEISKWLALKEVVLSDQKVPLLCRQMAMRAEVSARIWLSHSLGYDIYLSRSIERLKQIRHIREKYAGKAFSFETAFD